jgi:hypothetical protein
MSERNMVRVDWIDVQSLDLGLCMPVDLPTEPVGCSTIGFLVRENKSNFFLAKEVWDNGACKYVHIIPKRFVEKIVELEEAKK